MKAKPHQRRAGRKLANKLKIDIISELKEKPSSVMRLVKKLGH